MAPITSTPIAVQGGKIAGEDSSEPVSPATASVPLTANAQYHLQGTSLTQQTLLYPGGIPMTSPSPKPLALISLTDISRAAMHLPLNLPLNMEGVESADSADGRRGNGEQEKAASNRRGLQKPDFISIRPSATVPETPDQSPSIQPHSPLLFDSGDSNPEAPPVPKQTNIVPTLSHFKYTPKNPTHGSNSVTQMLTPPKLLSCQLSTSGEQCAVPRLSQTPQNPEGAEEHCQSTQGIVSKDVACVDHDKAMTRPLTSPGQPPLQDCFGETLLYPDADVLDDDPTPPLSLSRNPVEGSKVAKSTSSVIDLTALGDEEMTREPQTSKHVGSRSKSNAKLLGQPRRNVRMCTRRTAASATSTAEPEDEDTAGFKTKTLRPSRAASDSDMQNQVG